ncbi:MAG: NnrS family protein [Geminicoccaceae bacterium]
MAESGSERPTRRQVHVHPPILRAGFRPFFLVGSVFAPIAILLWLVELAGLSPMPCSIDPLAWHQHEMLFGFSSAIIAGFILTAIPSWTGRLPVVGGALAGLVLLWLVGRVAIFLGGAIGTPTAPLIDVAFLFVLVGLIVREIIKGSNWRNLPPALVIGLLAIANGLFHLEQQGLIAVDGLGTRLGIAAIATLIGLIGGRIVPSFTRNWLVKRQASNKASGALPSPFATFDKLALLLLAIALFCWVARPEARLAAMLLAFAGITHLIRLGRWRFWNCLAEPLVLILHIGYGWLAIGLLLLGLTRLIPTISDLAALHALTTGAFGTMMLAVMTRATLGHIGRALSADGWTVTIYAAVTAGAIARVLSPLLPSETWLQAAGLLWAGGFLLFALIYGRMLIGIRAEH